MIKEWKLDNFKSIDDEKDLEFRPLTLFTGANSSGKSTILQSILLVTQTLQSPIASRSILLNGWFKKFGTYTDIVNRRDYSKNIKFGFELTNDGDSERDFYRMRFGEIVKDVTCEFELSSDGNSESLQPILCYTHIVSTKSGEKQESKEIIDIKKGGERTLEEKQVIEKCKSNYQPSDFDYVINTNNATRFRYYGPDITYWKYIGASMYHFLPNYAIVYARYKDQLKQALTECLVLGRQYDPIKDENEKQKIITLIQEKVIEIVDDIYSKNKYNDDGKFKRVRESIKKNLTFTKLLQLFKFATLDGTEKQKYVDGIVAKLDDMQEQFVTDRWPLYYLTGVDFIRDFFNDRIKYLGPLREEPRSLYPLENNGSTYDLGLKGENTAAVFENNKTRIIKYVNPQHFEEGIVGELKVEEATLSEAINAWLVYLGVANKMSTNDRGKVGHELKITTDIKEMEQDLTHVGVGVSQILPILVMCFLAGKGDSIILEQPELHLHPKVQTRLADFFVSMNALGKQCILETHSEYLINRLRYLVAKTDDETISKSTMIYFVEKENGRSIYRSVTINKYGVIDEWPKGFFDESEEIAAQTLRAGMEKRKREQMVKKG